MTCQIEISTNFISSIHMNEKKRYSFNDFVENYSRQTTIYGDTIDPNEKIFEEY